MRRSSEQDRFISSLNDARRIVDAWPGWKQSVLGSTRVSANDTTDIGKIPEEKETK